MLAALAQSQRQGPPALVEFKAGRMNYDGRMVTPDRRRGLIRLVRDQMGMMTFQFLDADTKNPIENFYVFPDEAKFEKVKQTKDRVYLLEMKATTQRHFFWMQVGEPTFSSLVLTLLQNFRRLTRKVMKIERRNYITQ